MSSEQELVVLERYLGPGWQHLNTLIHPFVWQNVHIPALLDFISSLILVFCSALSPGEAQPDAYYENGD